MLSVPGPVARAAGPGPGPGGPTEVDPGGKPTRNPTNSLPVSPTRKHGLSPCPQGPTIIGRRDLSSRPPAGDGEPGLSLSTRRRRHAQAGGHGANLRRGVQRCPARRAAVAAGTGDGPPGPARDPAPGRRGGD
jgi:hypothetical protein